MPSYSGTQIRQVAIGIANRGPGRWLCILLGLVATACSKSEHHFIDADRERGLRLMSQYQCGRCHVIPQVPAADGRVGPALDRFGARSYIAGQVPNNPATLVRWIEEPQALRPGTAMPDMGVTPADARDMAAYLWTLK